MALPARTVLVTRLTSASSRKRLDRPGNELLNAFGGQPRVQRRDHRIADRDSRLLLRRKIQEGRDAGDENDKRYKVGKSTGAQRHLGDLHDEVTWWIALALGQLSGGFQWCHWLSIGEPSASGGNHRLAGLKSSEDARAVSFLCRREAHRATVHLLICRGVDEDGSLTRLRAEHQRGIRDGYSLGPRGLEVAAGASKARPVREYRRSARACALSSGTSTTGRSEPFSARRPTRRTTARIGCSAPLQNSSARWPTSM